MELFFTQAGMVVCAVGMVVLLVFLAVRSPLFYAVAQLLAMWLLMFSGAALGLYAAVALHRWVPLIVGALISAPVVVVCWSPMCGAIKSLQPLPRVWE